MAKLFDSHAHYTDGRFDSDRDELLTGLFDGPVGHILTCGTSYANSLECIALAEQWPGMYVAVGIHPEDVENSSPEDIEKLRALAAHPKVVALGEMGLDYHWDTPRDLQHFYFDAQLKLAAELELPVVIHDREAHGDTMDYVRKYQPKGVMHCFSGSAEMAAELVKLGMYVGFTGVVTFPNARKPLEAAAAVPLDKLLLETDCPYMAPVPCRGHRCDSGMIVHTAAPLAALHGITVEELLEITAQNAKTLFGI